MAATFPTTILNAAKTQRTIFQSIAPKEGNTKGTSYSIMNYGSSDECLLLNARGMLYEQEDIMEALCANKIPKIGRVRKDNSKLLMGVENILETF